MAVLDSAPAAAPASTGKEPVEITVPGVQLATAGESWQIFDEEAQRQLGMSGLAFMAAWQQGDFRGKEESLEVMRVALLMPGDWE